MNINRALSAFEYAELRIEHGKDINVKVSNHEIKANTGVYEGVSARVLENGSWGFASANAGADISSLLKKAQRIARLQNGKTSLKTTKSLRKKKLTKLNPSKPEHIVEELLKARDALNSSEIISKTISCIDSTIKKEFYNSLGTEIVQNVSYTYLSCSAVGRSDSLIQRASDTAASRNGFSKINASKTAINTKKKIKRLLDAKLPPKGNFTVILDPEMTGVLCHEAIGHATEADSVQDRESILGNKIGETIGSRLVNIIDNPRANDFGKYDYDDEGVKAKKVTLVENGLLKNFLSSMETAKALDIPLSGHARASGFDSVPIIRMSNTYLVPGKSSKTDVFDIKHGFYLKGMKGGSVDIFSGGFMFKAEEAYEVHNGECGRVLRDISISGNILKTLKDVVAVGKDFNSSPGMCGKLGQDVPVSDGGPHIQISKIRIG